MGQTCEDIFANKLIEDTKDVVGIVTCCHVAKNICYRNPRSFHHRLAETDFRVNFYSVSVVHRFIIRGSLAIDFLAVEVSELDC